MKWLITIVRPIWKLMLGLLTLGMFTIVLGHVLTRWLYSTVPLVGSRLAPYGPIIVFGACVGVGVLMVLSFGKPDQLRPGQNGRRTSGAHGTARWGTEAQLTQNPTGFLIGRAVPVQWRRWIGSVNGTLCRFTGGGHILTIASTGAGKGTGCVIPALLDYQGSILVTDPKGENFKVTARYRNASGYTVHALDPFSVVSETSASFNPLDVINPDSPNALDDAAMLASMVITSQGHMAEQPFWIDEGRGFLTGLILHVATHEPPEHRHLPRVCELLSLPAPAFATLLDEMAQSRAAGGLVARAAARFLQKADKERSGVLSTIHSHTHFLNSPNMARVLSSSSFDFADLKRSKATVYLILPPDRMHAYARWLRLMIASGMSVLQRTKSVSSTHALFLLDEFATLGAMEPVRQYLTLSRGFGITFWLLVQDLPQLKRLYPDWGTFISNAGVIQAFGTNDVETNEYLSAMLGMCTIHVKSKHQSDRRTASPGRQGNVSITTAEQGRALLTADEIRLLERMLVIIKKRDPLLLDRVNYLTDPEFQGRFNQNPMHMY
jgi:type IV secretion system protein VirD4